MREQIRCEECGQALDEDALMCWACGALTERGREKREGMEDADEWIRAAEQARQRRQQQEQEVDPDEALRQTLAQQGAVSELSRLDQEEATEDFLDRTAYDSLREMDTALRYLGTGLSIILGFLFVITLGVSFSLIGDNGLVRPLTTAVLAVIMGVAALLTYYLLRFVAEVGRAVADTADNTRRAVVTARILRRHLEEKDTQENE
ncbi:MAG: hypothetical protein ACLFWB_03990 [Armatimonadota bacterium]